MPAPCASRARLLRACALGLCVTIPVGLALAQRALDSSLRSGSGGRNATNRSAFPTSASSPYVVNKRTGDFTYNASAATGMGSGDVYSNPFRGAPVNRATGRDVFAAPPAPSRSGAAGLKPARYSASATAGAGATAPARRSASGAAGLQAPRYTPGMPGLAPVGAAGAPGLKQSTYKPTGG